MYKKILIITMLIPSVSVATNLSQEQLRELATKELPTLTRKFLPKEKIKELKNTQKKCDLEREKVKFGLKDVAIFTSATIIVILLFWHGVSMGKPGKPEVLE
jgi:hypothetical protein